MQARYHDARINRVHANSLRREFERRTARQLVNRRFRDALFFLAREAVKTADREAIADKINAEIESLREMSANKKLT